MFKTALSYLFILFSLAALWGSTSRSAMEYVAQHRDSDKWWGSYPCLHGDLVSMSYLDIVARFNPPKDNFPIKHPVNRARKHTVLYLDGDSYARHLGDSDFAGVQTYIPIDRNHGINYHLDNTKTNILIIEISERYFRPYFGGLQMLDEVCDSVIKKKSITLLYRSSLPNTRYASLLHDLHLSSFFNKYINQNLQGNLFNYNFIMPVFEAKAALNYYLFNRASGDVVISNDRNFLFLKETVTKTDPGSSYVTIPPEDIGRIVNNLNIIYSHYKESGFKEVYLSVIPNSATILQPEGYNKLIPLVQNDPLLKMKIIDMYTIFKNTPQIVYQPGDTHWNHLGRQLWLDAINEKLMNE